MNVTIHLTDLGKLCFKNAKDFEKNNLNKMISTISTSQSIKNIIEKMQML